MTPCCCPPLAWLAAMLNDPWFWWIMGGFLVLWYIGACLYNE